MTRRSTADALRSDQDRRRNAFQLEGFLRVAALISGKPHHEIVRAYYGDVGDEPAPDLAQRLGDQLDRKPD
jgi:hypothetical protein